MAAYPRAELEEMVERWLEANRQAEKDGDWPKHLGAMYTDDAEYRWNIGPNEEFVARNREEIEKWALGEQMEALKNGNILITVFLLMRNRVKSSASGPRFPLPNEMMARTIPSRSGWFLVPLWG